MIGVQHSLYLIELVAGGTVLQQHSAHIHIALLRCFHQRAVPCLRYIHIYTLHVDIRLYRVHKYYSDKYTILVYDIIIQYTYTINKTNCITELYKQTTIQYSTVLTYIIGRIHICSMLQQQLNNFNLIIIRCKRQCSFSSL